MNLIPDSLQLVMIRILTPLVRILLRNGIAHATFADIARKVYVDVGFEEAARRGQKTTISNVSIITGINRKEVKRLKEMTGSDVDRSLKKFNRVVRVLAGWQHDEEFLDEHRNPKVLPLEGGEISFTHLVRRYSGDMPVVAMLNALRDSGNIEVLDDGAVRLINPNFLPETDSEQKLNILGIDTAELISTINHNLLVTDPEDAWFQRKASSTNVSCSALPKLKQRINKRAQLLLEDIDSDFFENETDDPDDRCEVSVGIYFHMNETDSNEDSDDE